jgi:hypothetical protein
VTGDVAHGVAGEYRELTAFAMDTVAPRRR